MSKPISDEIRLQAIRLRTEQYCSLKEIRDKLGLARSTLSVLLRDYPLKPEVELKKLREAQKKARAMNLIHHEKIKLDEVREVLPVNSKMHKHYRGFIAEFYVKYRLLREGYTFYNPEFATLATDVIVEGDSGKYYRCEIKSTTIGNVINTLRMVYVGGNRIRDNINYSEVKGIDFFILITLENENMFIVPFNDIKDKGSVTCSIKSCLWKYRDRFDFFI